MTWILTASGKHFDFADPQPDQIEAGDIAQALSFESRFAGHTYHHYSVAQHSLMTSTIVDEPFALEALLHDASEAYCKDIPLPLKQMLPDYKAIERRVDAVIRARFGLPAACSQEVKRADLIMLATERRDLMPPDDTPWQILQGVTPLPYRIPAREPSTVLMQFLRRLDELLS